MLDTKPLETFVSVQFKEVFMKIRTPAVSPRILNHIEKYGAWIVINFVICLLPAFSTLTFVASKIPAASGYITHLMTLLVACIYPHILKGVDDSPPGGGLTFSLSLVFVVFFALLFPLLHLCMEIQNFVDHYFWTLVMVTIIPAFALAICLSWSTIKAIVGKAEANRVRMSATDTAQYVRGMKERI